MALIHRLDTVSRQARGASSGAFGAELKAHREAAGYTQEELATIAGLSVHAVSALERGERRRPQMETVRALAAALDLTGAVREAFLASARAPKGVIEDSPGGRLPRPLTPLVGRDAEMTGLRQWLRDAANRLITIVGPGGVGKTRLALELAHALAEEGATRVLFVPLATVQECCVVSAMAEAFGLVDVTPLDLPQRARAACRDLPTLLILDNCEHVLHDAPIVVELLATVPALRVLTTSRAPLRVRGEREYAIGPLASSGSAVRLFVDRVQDVRPDFRLTSANEATVTAICHRLDALPLALELAARWMKVLTAEDLLHRLDSDVLLSAAGPRDLPARQQTMNATVAWSYQLLDPGEQRAFRRFGTVPGRFSLAVAAEVLGGEDALPATAALIDKSLLWRDARDERRYYMLETVRAYAAIELEAEGECDDATEGLVRYCRREAARADDGLMGTAQAEWVARIQDDIESYRRVLTCLLEQGRAVEAAEIAWPLLLFWVIRGQVEGRRWYEQILQRSSLPPLAESRALICAASISYNQGDLARAHDELARAIPLARAAGGVHELARIDDLSARVEAATGNVDNARALLARAITTFDSLSMSVISGHTLVGMARVALALGDAIEAERLLDRAAAKLREAGPWFMSRAWYVRALLAIQRGEADRAIALAYESLTLSRQLDDKYALAFTLVPLASAAVLNGDYEWAARLIGAREATSERTGTTIGLKVAHDLHERAEGDARARLGLDRWNQAYAAGRAVSIESLLEELESRI